jgi:hypothetical protein
MKADRTVRKKGRQGQGVISPRQRPGDDRYLLTPDQLTALLTRFDLDPSAPWRWIFTSAPIAADGSMRLTFEGTFPTGHYFAADFGGKDFAPWAGYQFAMFGVTFDHDPGTGPRVRFPLPDEYTALVGPWNVMLLYRRAFHPEFPTYAEITWHPGEPEIGSIQELPTVGRAEALKIGERGLALLDMAAPTLAGRPEGYRKGHKRSATDLWRWWLKWQELDDEPTSKDLADWLGVKSRTTVERRLEEMGQTWPPTNPRRRGQRN